MKSTHAEDLDFLRSIRGYFGSRRMWCIEYEFTGEEIIERRGGRIKKRLRISDVMEIDVKVHPFQMILQTPQTEMKIMMLPGLDAVVRERCSRHFEKMTDFELRQSEENTAKFASIAKRTQLIAALLTVLFFVALGLLLVLARRH